MSKLLDAYVDSTVAQMLAQEPYKDLVPQRSPPGYPLGYIRERVDLQCLCGHSVHYSRLLVVERSSSKGRKIRPCGKSESFYDLEVAEVVVRGGTNACDQCFDTRPRESVPELPGLKERIGPSKGDKELSLDDFMNMDI